MSTLARTGLDAVLYNLDHPLPDGRVLYQHQKDAIQKAWQQNSIIIAHDVGIGKTIVSLVAAAGYGVRTLCIVKPKLIPNWQREADALGIKAHIFSWARMPLKATSWKPYVLVCDESHLYQSMSSARTKNMLNLASEAEAVIHLTGTPIPNGQPVNLFPLLLSIGHPLAENQREYEKRYCAGKSVRFDKKTGKKVRFWDNTGASNMIELHSLIKDSVLYKHKRDCLDLPPFTRVMREVELSRDMKALYDMTFDRAWKHYQERVERGVIESEGAHLVEMSAIRRAASIAKTETAVEVAKEILGTGSSVVVFTAFPESAKMVAGSLGCNAIVGGLGGGRAQSMCDYFARQIGEGSPAALCATVGAGGEGLNGMQAADYCILVDRGYTPAEAHQMEGRIERIGQTRSMTSIWLQLGELDRVIDEMLLAKQERIELVLQGKRKTMRGLQSAREAEREVARMLFEV